MALKIQILGNPVLREKTRQADLADPTLKELVKEMAETMKAAEGVGLATSQVGVVKRVIIFDVGEGLHILVNPELVWQSRERVEEEEGCLSIPGFKMPVKRAAKVRVKGYDLEGNLVELEADGLLARVLQHEIDHLNGKLVIDRTTPKERRRVLEEMVRP